MTLDDDVRETTMPVIARWTQIIEKLPRDSERLSDRQMVETATQAVREVAQEKNWAPKKTQTITLAFKAMFASSGIEWFEVQP